MEVYDRCYVISVLFKLSSFVIFLFFFFFQAEDGIRDAQESRGLGDVYKRQIILSLNLLLDLFMSVSSILNKNFESKFFFFACSVTTKLIKAVLTPPMCRLPVGDGAKRVICLLYTSDAADEEDSVDLGGRRIITKKKNK